MGIAGAAIASSFAEACSLAVLAIRVSRKMDKRLYGFFIYGCIEILFGQVCLKFQPILLGGGIETDISVSY
mgnify:CR=1 FL=1